MRGKCHCYDSRHVGFLLLTHSLSFDYVPIIPSIRRIIQHYFLGLHSSNQFPYPWLTLWLVRRFPSGHPLHCLIPINPASPAHRSVPPSPIPLNIVVYMCVLCGEIGAGGELVGQVGRSRCGRGLGNRAIRGITGGGTSGATSGLTRGTGAKPLKRLSFARDVPNRTSPGLRCAAIHARLQSSQLKPALLHMKR